MPKSEWTNPTIQLLAPVTLMSCDLLKNFSEELLPNSDNKDILLEEIKDIFLRAWKLDKLHEKFIQKNRQISPAANTVYALLKFFMFIFK